MQVRIIDNGTPEWGTAKSLVQSVYRSYYGASIEPGPEKFAAYYNELDQMVACGGITSATHKNLFSEIYLERPVQTEIAESLRGPVERGEIVEVGSLASASRKIGSELMVLIPFLVWCQGKKYILCTATAPLIKMFESLHINFSPLADASIERISEADRENWGTYYESKPVVGYINIPKMADMIFSLTARYSFKSLDMRLAAERMVA